MAEEEEGAEEQLQLELPELEPVPLLEVGDQQKKELQIVLEEFEDVWRKGPVAQAPYRIASAWQEAMAKEISHLLELGVIQQSMNSWTSPVVLVRKKDRSIWFCIDSRKITKEDVYPMFQVEEILNSLGKAKFVSTLDLAKGYHQLAMEEEDQKKTAFVVPQGTFEFS